MTLPAVRAGTRANAVRSARQRWTARVPVAVVASLTVIALLCAFSAVGTVFYGGVQPAREFIDEFVFVAPNNLGYAAFLFVLMLALARRKRVAYWMLLALLGFQLLMAVGLSIMLTGERNVQLISGGVYELVDPEWVRFAVAGNTLFTAAVLIVLALSIDQFYGRVQRASLPKAVCTLALLLVLFVGLGYGLVTAFPGTLTTPDDRFSWTVERVLGGVATFDVTREGHAPGWVNFVLGVFGMVAMFATLGTLFRSQRMAAHLSAAEERAIRRLLADHGDADSLGYFATRRDKAVFFAASGRAAIAYRLVNGVCLASGDPVGDSDHWQPVIEQWLAMCREFAWRPAVMGVGEQGARAYSRNGLKILRIGDEAVLGVATFSLHGRSMRPVRQAVHRLERLHHEVRVRRHRDVPENEMAEAARRANAWRGTETERGFSMALGRLGDSTDGDCVLVEALDPSGEVNALLSFVPWGRRGLSLDLMRRAEDADNGLVELMVAGLMRAAAHWGIERVSLNFAVFRAAFDEGARIGAGPVLRTWRGILLFFSRWWQLESLYRANVKYQPRWVPRFLGFADRRDLVWVGLASARAEGFLPSRRAPRWGDHEGSSAADRLPEPLAGAADREPGRPEQDRQRLAKLARLRAAGTDPYPASVPRTHSCAQVRREHGVLAADKRSGQRVAVAGRVMLVRDHGKLCFATVRDWSGELQVMLDLVDTGAPALRQWQSEVDLGDHVSVTGEVITTRTGELTVVAGQWAMAAKCLHPLPDKQRGLVDPELRVRRRYLDLVTNDSARTQLRQRGEVLHALRDLLRGQDFLEVETPILQPVHGGASASPFDTRMRAYDMRVYLRIAPELYLKRLCVGGVERVFELGRTFRNEGVSPKHNPEFTMLEVYAAHADYADMRRLCEDLVRAAAVAVHGRPVVWSRQADGSVVEHDLAEPWPVRPVNEALSTALGVEITADTEREVLAELCEQHGIAHDQQWSRGEFVLELYERFVEKTTSRPTFYQDFPTDVSPLTRPHRADSRLAERWDLVAFGSEVATAYSELIDPVEQRARLTEQSRRAAAGNPEAMELDEDFLTALEYAMPPTGGLGLGVDRLMMLLADASIRDTLAFPFVRPQPAR